SLARATAMSASSTPANTARLYARARAGLRLTVSSTVRSVWGRLMKAPASASTVQTSHRCCTSFSCSVSSLLKASGAGFGWSTSYLASCWLRAACRARCCWVGVRGFMVAPSLPELEPLTESLVRQPDSQHAAALPEFACPRDGEFHLPGGQAK